MPAVRAAELVRPPCDEENYCESETTRVKIKLKLNLVISIHLLIDTGTNNCMTRPTGTYQNQDSFTPYLKKMKKK